MLPQALTSSIGNLSSAVAAETQNYHFQVTIMLISILVFVSDGFTFALIMCFLLVVGAVEMLMI